VILTDVSADSVSLSWNSGNVEPISSYVVQFRAKYPTTLLGGGREDEEAEWRETVDVLRTEFTVRGLQAFTAYELRVLAVTSIGRSAPSATVDVTTAELGQTVTCHNHFRFRFSVDSPRSVAVVLWNFVFVFLLLFRT